MLATLTECGRFVPDVRSPQADETFHLDYPGALFDRVPPILPSTTETVVLTKSGPGANFSLPATAFLMGTTLSNPVSAAWPSASGLTQRDMDGDGKPGVTADFRSGGGYDEPLTASSRSTARADKPYVASRLVFSLNGTLTSCTASSGSATVSHLDTRILGCKIAGSTRDCSGSERDFLDQNNPEYQPGVASYRLAKLADGASCASVRQALP